MASGEKMIIPILHHERKVQVRDLTRINADQSVLVKGSVGAISAVKIKAGNDSPIINVYHENPKNWFIDWAFNDFKFDVDSTNNKIYFKQGDLVNDTTLDVGTYTLEQLIDEIADKIGAPVTIDERQRITIDPLIHLLPKYKSDSIIRHLGFQEDGQKTGAPVEYGLRKVTLTVETPTESESISEFMEVYSFEGDALFADDTDLTALEPDIMKWLPLGRASYKDLHRKAQKIILDWLDRQGYRNDDFSKITKFAFVDNSDVRLWATYTALNVFFSGVNNQVGDVFKDKAKFYHGLEIAARDRAVLNLDLNGDGKADQVAGPDIRSGRLFFR
jgi:hypothetical protein